MASTRTVATWLLGIASFSTACADALRLEPPTGGSGGSSSSSTQSGAGGGDVACDSNADCPEPTSVCDTVGGVCVECLQLSDCAFRPGTVCSQGSCVCPDAQSFCGPNQCVDLTTSQEHCGQCGHTCFGLCTAGACVDSWEPVGKKNAPSARYRHVAVWTGSKMVVWGGVADGPGNGAVATGAIYDPATFTWTPTSLVGAPRARHSATVVWTGSEMLVWGGIDSQDIHLSDGGRFDPAKNVWLPMTSSGAPTARVSHTAVWSGSEMIVWGGTTGNNELASGGRYAPATDKWVPITTQPTPVASRSRHCAVWDKNKSLLALFGGFGDDISNSANNQYFPAGNVTSGVVYNPVGENWNPISSLLEPSSRADLTCVYDGARTIVFGGFDGSSYLASGASYDPVSIGWQNLGGSLPEGRSDHTAVWLDQKKLMIVFGGRNPQPLDSGAILDGTTYSWSQELPRVLSARYGHTAVSTGDKMLVWGGLGPSGKLADGGIYRP